VLNRCGFPADTNDTSCFWNSPIFPRILKTLDYVGNVSLLAWSRGQISEFVVLRAPGPMLPGSCSPLAGPSDVAGELASHRA
jgi:hypothetical protein